MTHQFIRIVCANCGHFFDVPVYCGDRFCPICSVARRKRVRDRLNFLVNNVPFVKDYGFKHLTLTIKNQRNLSRMTYVIRNSFRKLRQTDEWKRKVLGGAFVIEVTGCHGSWHVHLHIIIQAKYWKFSEILKLWMRLSPGRGVFIQNIPKAQVIRYLTKYVTKSDVLENDKDELNEALKGTRLFQPFGTWYNINKLYVKPAQTCPNCDKPCFLLYGELFEGEGFLFEKEVPD